MKLSQELDFCSECSFQLLELFCFEFLNAPATRNDMKNMKFKIDMDTSFRISVFIPQINVKLSRSKKLPKEKNWLCFIIKHILPDEIQEIPIVCCRSTDKGGKNRPHVMRDKEDIQLLSPASKGKARFLFLEKKDKKSASDVDLSPLPFFQGNYLDLCKFSFSLLP